MSLSLNQIFKEMTEFQNPNGSHRYLHEYPDLKVRDFEYKGFAGTNMLVFKANIESQSKPGSYGVAVQFYNQAPSKEKSNVFPFKVDINGVTWYFPIPDGNSRVALLCKCNDFYFRWAYWLAAQKALIGPAPVYKRKTETRPEVNPNHKAGLCKHLWSFLKYLDESNLINVR